jgi:hypothetical protein
MLTETRITHSANKGNFLSACLDTKILVVHAVEMVGMLALALSATLSVVKKTAHRSGRLIYQDAKLTLTRNKLCLLPGSTFAQSYTLPIDLSALVLQLLTCKLPRLSVCPTLSPT